MEKLQVFPVQSKSLSCCRRWPACRRIAPRSWRAARGTGSGGSIWPKSVRKSWSTAWCDPQTSTLLFLHSLQRRRPMHGIILASEQLSFDFFFCTLFYSKPTFGFSNSLPRPREAAQCPNRPDVLLSHLMKSAKQLWMLHSGQDLTVYASRCSQRS